MVQDEWLLSLITVVDSSLDAWTIHQFLIVMLDLFLRNKLFSILQFLGNLFAYLFELDQPIDSLVVAENS